MKIFAKLLLSCCLILASAPEGAALTGRWRGELTLGPNKLPLVFSFSEVGGGITTATMDSPMQNAVGIPLAVTLCTADSVSVSCPSIGASFSGRVAEGRIAGTFSQSGYKFPLVLTPEESILDRRPQTPQPPFPYTVTDTVFASADGTLLAGTLTMPECTNGNTVPVVVMLTGSGPQNRDEEIFEHRPFAVIADMLARNGVASLRFDDRGTGKSEGSFAAADINTFKADAESALAFVRSLPGFGKAGFLGHSEGGSIAVVSAPESRPDFIISLAGMVVPSRETLLAQNRRSLEANGVTGAGRDASLCLLGLVFDEISRQYAAGKNAPIDIDALCEANGLTVPDLVLQSVKAVNTGRNGYFDSLVSLDPTPFLSRISCPVLAINGSKDTQVDAKLNLGAFSARVKNVEVHEMPGLNHLMQHADTGDVAEYGQIKETISPEVLEIMSTFLEKIK